MNLKRFEPIRPGASRPWLAALTLLAAFGPAGSFAGRAAQAAPPSLAEPAPGGEETHSAVPLDNPYASVVVRNVFGIQDPPPPPPPPPPPEQPLPKITPTGVYHLFDSDQVNVIFQVVPVAQNGQPADKEYSRTLPVGDTDKEITVVSVSNNETNKVITFNNHGTLQDIPLNAATPSSSGPAAGAAPAPGPGGSPPPAFLRNRIGPGGRPLAPGGMPMGMGTGTGNGAAPAMGMGMGTGNNPAPAMGMGMGMGMGGGTAAASAVRPQINPNQLTPEAQAILMEKNRADLESQNSPIANLIPQTPLTEQLRQERLNSGGGGNP